MPAAARVVHVVDNLCVGGAQQLLVTWAREAARRSDPVTVVSLSAEQDRPGEQLRALGAEVVVLPRSAAGPAGTAGQVRALRRLLAARRPAVVQTHLTHAHLVGLPAARLAGVPAVATLHSTRVGDDGNSARALRLETLLLRRVARAVVACGAVVERAQRDRLAPRAAVVVPNATEPVPALSAAARDELRAVLGGAPDAPLVVAVGRLVDGKGYDELLDAFEHVAQHRGDAVLLVVGDGPEAERLRARAQRPPLAGRVRFLGQRHDVPQVLAAADVYVSASHWEGLPLAMLEAMAAGLPVVVTAVGDVPTVVQADCGRLVPPRQVVPLAHALLELLGDDERRRQTGSSAQRRVGEVAGVAQWYDRLRAVHRAVQR